MGVGNPDIKAIFDASELVGWELRAAWDDLKLGLKHGSKFSKIAVINAKNWQAFFAKISSWFMSGELKLFDNYAEAFEWLEDD